VEIKKIRLDKFLADCGKGTRSRVKEYIKNGRVTVNGVTAKSGDTKLDTDSDTVCFDGERLSFQRYVYYMLNKPSGVVSATTDSRDKTVVELITEDKPRDLFPVGRLDKDTEGLLIITNDGKLASSLLSPKKHVAKTYYARVVSLADDVKLISDSVIQAMREGIDIGDDKPTAPAELTVLSQSDGESDIGIEEIEEIEIKITITEGRYHQVKRMFQAVGFKVVYLKRLAMGTLTLDDNLRPGEYRQLSDEELSALKNR
jgi:16S rRNA pseudouridine516 synthase